jgi:hypothetical protein
VSLCDAPLLSAVVPALGAGMNVFMAGQDAQDVDGGDKPGHDGIRD